MILRSFYHASEIRMIVSSIRAAFAYVSSLVLSVFQYFGGLFAQVFQMNVMKVLWVASHLACALGFFASLALPQPVWYHISVTGAISTYAVSVFRLLLVLLKDQNPSRDEIPLASLLNSESSLLLTSSCLHATSSANSLKLFSFAVFSYMNLIAYLLREVVLTNKFTTSLYPLLGCIEPVLFNLACSADYLVQIIYYRDYFSNRSSLAYGLVYSYICFKRLEKSELSRMGLYSIMGTFRAFLVRIRAPKSILRLWNSFQLRFHILVPIEPHVGASADSERASGRTRATSLFFEPALIIDDIS